jgi:uncharacterized protein YbjT (DUF2867 family)
VKIILFGATGMVGQGVLRECLLDKDVSEVYAVGRSVTGQHHQKLNEVTHKDFTDFSSLKLDADAIFWCLGVTSAGMSEPDYTRITHDYTIAAAKALVRPTMTFIFVSGRGADGKAMWARVKHRTEEALFAMPFRRVFVFRPSIIEPLHGIKSRTRLYNILYPILYPFVLIAKTVKPELITTTERVGRAMLNVAKNGFPKNILENPDINAAAMVGAE